MSDDPWEQFLVEEAVMGRFHEQEQIVEAEQQAHEQARRQGEELLAKMSRDG